jgi:hypothetical protein
VQDFTANFEGDILARLTGGKCKLSRNLFVVVVSLGGVVCRGEINRNRLPAGAAQGDGDVCPRRPIVAFY